MTNLNELSDDIIKGKRFGRTDDLSFFKTCDIKELTKAADKIRAHFKGDRVDLCTIINGRSGKCGENCKFCAQSAHNHTGCEEYSFLDEEKIISEAKSNQDEGVNRFAIVTAGRALTGEDFEKALHVYERMNKELSINLCASMGFINREQFKRLRKAGVTSYHHNIETSRRNFPNICTSHSYDMKIETIKIAQEEGLCVCSGGIIGMGETFEDRIDMALSLHELGIRSIPINALMAIPGTPFEKNTPLTEEEILRTLAMFRFINPEANIRLAAGRKLLSENGKKAFESGCSATITGNMLTTSGSTIQGDIKMLREMGRITKAQKGTTCDSCDCSSSCDDDSCCCSSCDTPNNKNCESCK
ncbi:MAG: biotin synthase BioB [Treponema sp.]|uniref:biotin synthase BioB n=1 Tax=Treponema sp. TaxID=166 RepID=UPI0025DA7396|nr:biotin synthase BioB [Treponema sp.]MBQ8679827.1 biotin synthase BioB [Treponema sp.]